MGIWEQRTGLGGAGCEMVGVLHSQAQPAVQAGGMGRTRSQWAWQFGEVHLLDLKGSLAWNGWERNCCGLEYGWKTSWTIHVKRRACLLDGGGGGRKS